MENVIKKLSKAKEKQLQRTDFEKYQEYYKYMRSVYEKSKLCNMSLEKRRKLYPLLYKALKLMNLFAGHKISVIGDKRIKNDKPKIFAVTHIGKCDVEVVMEVLKEHAYLLSGDFENIHSTVNGLFLETNGIVYVNEYDKEDRKSSKLRMIDALRQGANIMYFPEGTWNLSCSKPMLEIFPGIVDVAIESGADIIPVGIEQYNNNFVVNIGENIDANMLLNNGLAKTDIKDYLRDVMATLKWSLYEAVPAVSRETISDDYYEKFLDSRMSEWPGFTLEEVREKEYKNKTVNTYDEVFEHLQKIDINKENAFLLKKC